YTEKGRHPESLDRRSSSINDWFDQRSPCLAHSISTVWCSAMMPVKSSRSRLRKGRLSAPSKTSSRTKRDLHLITFPQTHSFSGKFPLPSTGTSPRNSENLTSFMMVHCFL